MHHSWTSTDFQLFPRLRGRRALTRRTGFTAGPGDLLSVGQTRTEIDSPDRTSASLPLRLSWGRSSGKTPGSFSPMLREDARDDEDAARALFRHLMSTYNVSRYEKANVRSIVWLFSGAGDESSIRVVTRLRLPFALATINRAARIHATRERRVHELIVHLSLILLLGYGVSRNHPAPFDCWYFERDFGETLKSKCTKGHLLVRFGDDVRCRRWVKSGKHGPTMLMDLIPARQLFNYGRRRRKRSTTRREDAHNSCSLASLPTRR